MTAKEKAKLLVDKFIPYMYCYRGSGMLSNDWDLKIATDNAKQCAFILCDEIITDIHHGKKRDWIVERTEETEFVPYWYDVKKEIEKL